MVANESGVFTCRMCTAISDAPAHLPKQCNESSVNFFVTDFSTGFDFEAAVIEGIDRKRQPVSTNASVIEKDIVQLTCAASIYEFEDVTWYKIIDGYPKHVRSGPPRRSEPKVQNYNSNFSMISRVTFREIEYSNEGTYECHATPRDKSSERRNKTFSVAVLEMIAPEKGPFFNIDVSEAVFSTGDSLDLNCTVNPDARPKPTVTWTKDGNSSNLEDDSSIQWLNDGQRMRIKYLVHVHSGFYQCRVESRAGGFISDLNVIVKEDSTVSRGLIAGIVVGVIVLLVISGVLLWKVKIYNRKFKELTQAELMLFETGDPSSINPELGLEDQADLLPYEKEYEFDRSKLKLGRQLGAGAFGRVLKAQAFGIVQWERSTTVAVKMVKPHADITYIKALMAELKIMSHIGKHLNIVNLLGACTVTLNKRELLVIVEYCRFGNIQKYLMVHRHHFIDQVDPLTGEINFMIGEDIMDGDDDDDDRRDMARVREDEEMSVAYARRMSLVNTSNGDWAGIANAAHTSVTGEEGTNGTSACAASADCAEAESCGGASRSRAGRQTSVRYIADPAAHKSALQRKKKDSIMSDYEGLDQIVLTDMTVLPADTTGYNSGSVTGGGGGGGNRFRRNSRTSNVPGWRSSSRVDNPDGRVLKPICTKDLVCWAYQVTRGMDYLAGKKVMHGDLACRNILLAADNVVKICDFGLAKDIYKTDNYRKKTDGPLPIKWMAVESLRDRVFSTQSDVWSFGIVLWEMFSLGKTPYPGIDPGATFYEKLLNGYRMEKPENCPMIIYRAMSECWAAEPGRKFNSI